MSISTYFPSSSLDYFFQAHKYHNGKSPFLLSFTVSLSPQQQQHRWMTHLADHVLLSHVVARDSGGVVTAHVKLDVVPKYEGC